MPAYFWYSTVAPTATLGATVFSLPSSSVVWPGPTATTLPMVGFSLEPSVSSRPPLVLLAASTTCAGGEEGQQRQRPQVGGGQAAAAQAPRCGTVGGAARSWARVEAARTRARAQAPHLDQHAVLQRLQLADVIARQQANDVVLLRGGERHRRA